VGHGGALPDVPARDLTSDELDTLAHDVGPLLLGHGGRVSFVHALIDSGLYVSTRIAVEEAPVAAPVPAAPAESE
jgi:hypothetical protein